MRQSLVLRILAAHSQKPGPWAFSHGITSFASPIGDVSSRYRGSEYALRRCVVLLRIIGQQRGLVSQLRNHWPGSNLCPMGTGSGAARLANFWQPLKEIAEIVVSARIIKRSRAQKDCLYPVQYYITVKADETSVLLTEAKRQIATNKCNLA